MSFKDKINNLKPIEYKEHFKNLSFEKFMLYAALTLEEKEIPLTFSYLCIATYKLFPEKFWFDDEFTEYPAWEKLNRTYMHLKYVPKGKDPFLSWSIEKWYNLTNYWRQQAKMAKAIIDWDEIQITAPRTKKNVKVKQWRWKYNSFLNSNRYKKYDEKWEFDELWIYSFFWFSPFSQNEYIKNTLKTWKEYAKEDENIKCLQYIDKLLSMLQ